MSTPGGWTRRLDKLQASLPEPPAGSPYWRDSFARLGYAFRLEEREPEYAAAITAYGELRPPYGDEAERLHEHLCELLGRAADKTPPCSAAEFNALAAWLATHGDALPVNAGWPPAIEVVGGVTATLSDLRWRAGRGATAVGSDKLAETIRKLKAKYLDGVAAEAESKPTRSRLAWQASVVRDGDPPFEQDGVVANPACATGGVEESSR